MEKTHGKKHNKMNDTYFVCFSCIKFCCAFLSAYEYVQDTEEASDSVQSSVDAMSPRQYPDSDTETTLARRQMLEEMQEMQDRIHAVFSGK